MATTAPRTGTRARSPGTLLLFGLSAGFTLFLLILVDIVAGLFVGPETPREIAGDSVSRTVTYIEVNPAPLERDVDLLWRNVPNARKTQPVNPRAFGTNEQWTIENDSLSFRGPELIRPEAAERIFRILCVGDSITFGFSVDQPDTYPNQLSELLKKRFPDRRFEVINAGVPGWSWLQGLRFLDLHAAELAPDLIIIGHGTNDQLFPAKMTDEERFLRLGSFSTRMKQKLAVFAVETNIYRAISRMLPEKPADQPSPGCREQILKEGGCRRVAIGQIATAVEEVAKLAAGTKSDLLVLNTDFVQTAAVRGVRQTVESKAIPFIDLVAEANRRARADEEERASKLTLAPATSPSEAAPKGSEPKRIVLRVLVPDPRESYWVDGLAYFHPEFAISQPLFDDGTHGDEKAGDGVFSTTVELPATYSALEYKFRNSKTAEFEPLPPRASTLGDRVLQATGSRIGPVDLFGRSLFMVERAHPNRDGHRLIAQLVADRIAEMPAFRRYVGTAVANP